MYRNEARGDDWGIQATDGSHSNLLLDNDAKDNHVHDCELTGDTLRYGYLVPGCFENVIVQRRPLNLVVKDCGANNEFHGSVTLVDTSTDPCF